MMMVDLSPEEAEIVASLDPVLQKLALEHKHRCVLEGVPFIFTSGCRARSYQQMLHDHPELHPGTPAAPGGSSKHEVGGAYDAGGKRNQLQVMRFGLIAEELGLKWGGRFMTNGLPTPDYVHCELPWSRAEIAIYRLVSLFR